MKKILKEREKGITLIALVITIIILLILAGVSIAMLTGDNGIITRANEASEKTKKSNAEEQVDIAVQGSYGTNGKINIDSLNDELKNIEGLKYKGKEISETNKIESLPDKVNLDGNEIIINEDGSANRIIRMEEYQTEDTKPYLPGSEFKQVEGTNLENGLVVTDGTNYWTWIEVPITKVFTSAKAEDEYDKIEDDLEAYTGDLVDREGYTDQWYDYYGMSYDGSSGYGQVSFPTSIKFDEAKGYYGAIYIDNTGTTEAPSFGSASTIIRMAEYQTEDTKPYLPGSNFSQVEGTDLSTGLVVTDGTNYWTWIEVPKTQVFASDTTENDYDKIEDDLEAYTGTLLSRNGYTDQWYDYYGASYDGNSPYSQVKFLNASQFNDAKSYYGAIYSDNAGATPVETFGNSSITYYVRIIDDKLDDNRGCGLTYEEYNNLKKYMLSSVYRNGGFWIGQYEAGADSYPAKEDNSRILIIAQGKYPYNYITCANAQIKSSELNSGDYTSSLMFGIQWDLVIKHLQVRGGMSVADLTTNSTSWGNYNDATFKIENGKYTTSPTTANSFKPYTEDTSGYVENSTKLQNKSVLLTTGASSQNCKMNIYDIAGNEYEWTLERSTDADDPCTSRGGYYSVYGTNSPASSRGNYRAPSSRNHFDSFRSALY